MCEKLAFFDFFESFVPPRNLRLLLHDAVIVGGAVRMGQLHRKARAFLEQNPDFFPIPLELPGDMGEGDTAMVTLLPGKFETDGFFICKMGRRP